MSSQLVMVNRLLRSVVKPVINYMSMQPHVVLKRRPLLCGAARLLPMPSQFKIKPVYFSQFNAEWVDSEKNASETEKRVVLYLPGGGYIACSPITHRNLTTRMTRFAQARVLAVNYRKSPEYPYPYALEDSVEAYKWLLDQGYKPENITIAGDSAGGNLTLVTLLELRDRKLPLPAGGVCLSPWTDLTCSGDSMRFNRSHDPMIPSRRVKHAARLHANGMLLDDPRISPLYAELHGLPPIMIHVGDNEVLLSDSTRFAAKAKSHGVNVNLKVWRNAPHVFQLFAGVVPQSNHSLKEIGEFMQMLWGEHFVVEEPVDEAVVPLSMPESVSGVLSPA